MPTRIQTLAIVSVLVVLAGGAGLALRAAPPPAAATNAAGPSSTTSVEVTELQARQLAVQPVPVRPFVDQREAVGYIDFNQDRTTPVYASYAGRISKLQASAGDDVRAGDVLFYLESPDLAAAESALIGAAAARTLTHSALERAQGLVKLEGYAQKDYEQALSDAQTAEGVYGAAVKALRVYGKTDADIERLVATQRVDSQMPVRSPLNGRVVLRAAAPGTFIQPGVAPAPYTVADLSSVWLEAGVVESDLPAIRTGQPVEITVTALPGRRFRGKVTNVGVALDPATHRVLVRSEIADPAHELHPQMLAAFVIQTGPPHAAMAMPVSGVVREGDGTMTVWVTRDRRTYTKRTVHLGREQDGYVELLDGVKPGDLVATDGALFLSNALVEAQR